MIGRTGLPGQNFQVNINKTEQAEEDCQNRGGLSQEDYQDRIAKKWDSQDGRSTTGKIVRRT